MTSNVSSAFIPNESGVHGHLRGGVIGFGAVARSVVRQLGEQFPDVCIEAVCDPDEECLASASRDFNIPNSFRDVEGLCAQSLDFVLVLSANRAHADNVKAAATQKIPIFCEKPVAIHLADADAMVEAVEKTGVLNLVNYSLRFHPAYHQVRDLYQAGKVGEILAVQCSRSRGYGLHAGGARHPVVEEPEASGGWIIHHACHAIDAVYWLAGEFEQVTARMHTTHSSKDSPEVLWGLGVLKSGATAVIGDSVCAVKQETLMVQGTEGHILLDIPDRQTARIRLYQEGREQTSPEIFEVERGKPRAEALSQFFSSVRSGTASSCTIRDARHSLAVAIAMEESARSGGYVPVP